MSEDDVERVTLPMFEGSIWDNRRMRMISAQELANDIVRLQAVVEAADTLMSAVEFDDARQDMRFQMPGEIRAWDTSEPIENKLAAGLLALRQALAAWKGEG